MWKWSVVLAGFLLILGTATVWADCKPGETFETITGKLEFDLEATAYSDTPYALRTQGSFYELYPDGPYFGMKWGESGFEQNANAKLSGFVDRQVSVTGCTSTTSSGKFHEISNISQVLLA